MRQAEVRGSCCWPSGFEGAVTLTFDGGYSETFDSVLPLLDECNHSATWFLVTGSVGQLLEGRPVASWSAWDEALKKGMELGSHTVTHPSLYPSFASRVRSHLRRILKIHRALRILKELSRNRDPTGVAAPKLVDDKTLVEEAVTAARDIIKHTGTKVTSFAYPYGRFSRRCEMMLRERGFLSARTTDNGINTASDSPYRLRTNVVTRKTSAMTLNSWVDQVLNCGGWLIETYHLVSAENQSGYEWWISSERFAQHLNYLRQSRVWVASQDRVVQWLYSNGWYSGLNDERRKARF